jgi:hypothetical protein
MRQPALERNPGAVAPRADPALLLRGPLERGLAHAVLKRVSARPIRMTRPWKKSISMKDEPGWPISDPFVAFRWEMRDERLRVSYRSRCRAWFETSRTGQDGRSPNADSDGGRVSIRITTERSRQCRPPCPQGNHHRTSAGPVISDPRPPCLVVDTMVAMYRLGVAPALLFGLGWRVPRI